MTMEIEKKFIRNFLSKPHNNHGKVAAFFIITVCTIMSLFYWDKSYEISTALAASKDLIFVKHEYWRLFTTTFIHGDIKHLLSNSLMLFILTYFVTSFYGLTISLVLSSIMGMLINYVVISQYQVNTTLVGISGVIYFLWGFWMILYLFIETHMSFIKRLIRVVGVFLILLIPTTYSPQTSYMAHYFGYFVGVGCAIIYYLLNYRNFSAFEQWEYREVPPDPELEEEFILH